MSGRWIVSGVVLAALAAGVWFGRGELAVGHLASAVGLPLPDSTPAAAATLAAAGVHKCSSAAGPVYLDRPCPAGSHELAAHGGTVTVVSFPGPAPSPETAEPAAAGVTAGAGNGLVKGFSREEIDRMRDKQIEDAARR